MGIFQRSTLSLFFPVGKGIAKPEDLRGKRIMLCPGDGLIQYLPAYLKAFGMELDAVKTVTVDCSIKYSAVAQGQADAVASYGTAGKPLMQAVGIAEVGKFDYADAGIFLPAHGIITSTAHVRTTPRWSGSSSPPPPGPGTRRVPIPTTRSRRWSRPTRCKAARTR